MKHNVKAVSMEKKSMDQHLLSQTPLPESILQLPAGEIEARIAAAKRDLDGRVVILGHHYQRDEVIQFADYRGDSLKLSQQAASRSEAEYIVFCGVHFMAESADLLSAPHQKVLLPDLNAGCSMADMADLGQVEDCWEALTKVSGELIIPITYINSSAAIKSFCGRHGGIVCTSSNALRIMQWAYEWGEKILFLPDEHLGRNTGVRLGIPLEAMAVWDPQQDCGGLTAEQVRDSRLFLWHGFCSVHQRFTVDQIARARARHPEVRVVVHPECSYEVVQAADDSGSTEYIIRVVSAGEPHTTWAIGTEIHLVNRLAQEQRDKTIFCLDDCVCFCATMYRIDPPHLLWTLENLRQGQLVNQITVPEDTAYWARVALDRMLALK